MNPTHILHLPHPGLALVFSLGVFKGMHPNCPGDFKKADKLASTVILGFTNHFYCWWSISIDTHQGVFYFNIFFQYDIPWKRVYDICIFLPITIHSHNNMSNVDDGIDPINISFTCSFTCPLLSGDYSHSYFHISCILFPWVFFHVSICKAWLHHNVKVDKGKYQKTILNNSIKHHHQKKHTSHTSFEQNHPMYPPVIKHGNRKGTIYQWFS